VKNIGVNVCPGSLPGVGLSLVLIARNIPSAKPVNGLMMAIQYVEDVETKILLNNNSLKKHISIYRYIF